MKKLTLEATDENILNSIKNDTCHRNSDVKDFVEALETIEGNMFISVGARWGEGKTFFDKYKNARFEDLNIQYLCKTYCDGLKSQMDSCEKYFENKDYATWSNTWTAAYNKRSYVIVELSEYYNAPFTDISEMKDNTKALDSLNEA